MNWLELTKKDWQWLYTHRCKRHNRRYTEHPACFEYDYPGIEHPATMGKERVGFLDIEASNLDANFGFMITWTILADDGAMFFDYLKDEDFKKGRNAQEMFQVDKRIVKHLIDILFKFDRIVTHYGRKFDLPFIRTRALIDGIPFPGYGSLFNDDTYSMARRKLKLNSNRLDSIARTLFGHSDKTHLDGAIWTSAARGDRESIKYILDHNKIDVIELRKIWYALKEYVPYRRTSI